MDRYVSELGGVIYDDLPAIVGVFEDEGEESFSVSAVFFAAFEMIFADDHGEVFIERVDFEVSVGEGTHGGLARVVVLVLVDEAGEATEDLMGDEEGVGRVFVAAGEGVEVAVIPGVLLREEDLDDVEFLASCGVERVWILRCEEGGGKEGEAEGGEAKRAEKGHLGLGEELISLRLPSTSAS